MRCDLHVHSARSGAATVPVLGRVADESYAEPAAVYEALRAKGMDLVTLTDHDTIAVQRKTSTISRFGMKTSGIRSAVAPLPDAMPLQRAGFEARCRGSRTGRA